MLLKRWLNELVRIPPPIYLPLARLKAFPLNTKNRLARVHGSLVAEVSAVSGFKGAKDECRKHGEDTEEEECPVNAADHDAGVQAGRRGNEDGSSEPGDGDSEADGELLRRAGDGTGHAGVLVWDVGIGERVHAGVLERGEGSVTEREQHDEPDGRVSSDGGEEAEEDSNDDGVGDENGAVADAADELDHDHLQAHGGESLRHDQQTGLHRRVPKADLIQQRKKKWDAADSETCEEASADGSAERSDGEKTEL